MRTRRWYVAHVPHLTQLLGRELYQQALVEPLLVWGSLALHVGSSLVRRALLPRSKVTPPWRWSYETWHSAAGYVLMPVLLVHVWLNRLVPARSEAPIYALSPSELDLSFVGFGLSDAHFGAPTWALYGVLTVAGAMHWLGGAPKMARRFGKRVSPRCAIIAAASLAGALLLGCWSVAREGVVGIAADMLQRVRIQPGSNLTTDAYMLCQCAAIAGYT